MISLKFEFALGKKIFTLEKLLKELSIEVSKVSTAIDQVQEYSCSYMQCQACRRFLSLDRMKMPSKRHSLCLRIFNGIVVEVKPYDIDISHRITPRHATEGRPKPIICKFTRRITREQVTVSRKEVNKINPTSIGLPENVSMEHAGILDHLTPRLQGLLQMQKSSRKGPIMPILLGQKLDSMAEEKREISTHRNTREYEGSR